MTNPGGYAFTVDADDLARSGEPEFRDYNDSHSPELVYPHEGVTPDGRNSLGEDVFSERPGMFYVESLPHKPTTSQVWISNSITLAPGSPSVLLIGPNPKRKRLVVWNNTISNGVAWVSARPMSTATNADARTSNSGGVQLPANDTPIELTHTGAVYAIGSQSGAPNGCTVSFFEESYC